MKTAERLRDTIAARPIDTAEGPLHVTISVGVAGVDIWFAGARWLDNAMRAVIGRGHG